jgi:hypothetical protein
VLAEEQEQEEEGGYKQVRAVQVMLEQTLY